MIKIFKEQFLIPIFIILITLISLYPLYKRVLATPPDQVFLGTQFYSDDYAVYNSVIRQGIDGRWFFTNKYSTEETSPSPLRFQYLLLGKIGGIFNLSAPQTYHLSRIFLGLIFLLTTYVFFKEFTIFSKSDGEPPRAKDRGFPPIHGGETPHRKPQNTPFTPGLKSWAFWCWGQKPVTVRLVAFVLALFAASLPKIVDGNLSLRLASLPEIDPAVRFFAQPHYQMASIINLTILILFINFLKKRRLSHLVLTVILSLLAMIADPSSIIITVSTLLLTTILVNSPLLIESYRKRKIIIPPSTQPAILFLTVLIAISTISSLWLQSFQGQEPWKTIFTWDKTSQFPITISEYLLAIGPIVLLAPLGLLALLSKRSIKGKFQKLYIVNYTLYIVLILSWLISFFALVFLLSPIIGVNRVRFLHAPSFIFIAGLASVGLVWLASSLKSLFRLSFSLNTFYLILATLALLPSLPSFIGSLNYQINEWPPSSTLVYPTKDQYEGMLYLKDYTHKDEVILALYEAANVIPFISGNSVFAGNITETLNYGRKNGEAAAFFQGSLSESAGASFLKENRISYLFVGFQEAAWGTDFAIYPFLTKVYENQKVKIYQFTPPQE